MADKIKRLCNTQKTGVQVSIAIPFINNGFLQNKCHDCRFHRHLPLYAATCEEVPLHTQKFVLIRATLWISYNNKVCDMQAPARKPYAGSSDRYINTVLHLQKFWERVALVYKILS